MAEQCTAPNLPVVPSELLAMAEAHAVALAMYNAVNAQQHGAILRQAAATMVCTVMLSLGSSGATSGDVPPPVGPDMVAAPSPAPPILDPAALADAIQKVSPGTTPAVGSADFGGTHQAVAQSTALAIQDAADYLRNTATIAITANGVALARLAADPDGAANYAAVLAATQQFMAAALANFEAIGASAESLLQRFP